VKFLGLFVAVGIVSIFQMYVAVPIGLSGDLSRGSIIIAAWLGGMIGVVAFVYWGGRIVALIGRFLNWVLRRPAKKPDDDKADKEPGRVQRYTARFGEPFLGIVGPFTIGGWGAAILGTSMGLSKPKLIIWLALGQAMVVVAYVWGLKAVTQ
jgi:hypothetical protein